MQVKSKSVVRCHVGPASRGPVVNGCHAFPLGHSEAFSTHRPRVADLAPGPKSPAIGVPPRGVSPEGGQGSLPAPAAAGGGAGRLAPDGRAEVGGGLRAAAGQPAPDAQAAPAAPRLPAGPGRDAAQPRASTTPARPPVQESHVHPTLCCTVPSERLHFDSDVQPCPAPKMGLGETGPLGRVFPSTKGGVDGCCSGTTARQIVRSC